MIIRCLFVFFGVYGLATVAAGQEAPESSLKTIMQELRNDTVLILDAMLVDDMAAVADAAVRIADHPRIPPDQVSLIASELGPEMATFKQFDSLVHDLSVAIREAAGDGDRDRVQMLHRDMVAGCLGCHAAYRERVMMVLADET